MTADIVKDPDRPVVAAHQHQRQPTNRDRRHIARIGDLAGKAGTDPVATEDGSEFSRKMYRRGVYVLGHGHQGVTGVISAAQADQIQSLMCKGTGSRDFM